MGARRKTGVEDARAPALSRREIIAGTSAAALGGAIPTLVAAFPDDGTRRCKQWLALTARIERLQDRWARLEDWLVREHDWLQLSPAEQQTLPWAKELRDIDGCLDVLFEQRESLLASLPTAGGGVSLDAVITRLAVVERLIWSDTFPEAHALIAGARRQLVVMSARGGVV